MTSKKMRNVEEDKNQIVLKQVSTFAAFLHERARDQSVFHGVQQFTVGLEAGEATLKASLRDERPGKVSVHRVSYAT